MRKFIRDFCLLSLCCLSFGTLAAKQAESNKCECNCQQQQDYPNMYTEGNNLCGYHRSQVCRPPCQESPEQCGKSRAIGSAFGAATSAQEVVIQSGTLGINDAPVTAPLFYAAVPEKAPFTFTPYNISTRLGGFFTINKAGKYLLQYGLTGVPSKQLAFQFVQGYTTLHPSPVLWIAISIVRGTCRTFAGAIPLSFTSGANLDPGATGDPTIVDGSKSYFICSGFGQIPLCLKACDKVSLQVYLASNPNVGSPSIPDVKLYIGSDNITWPFQPYPAVPGLSRGPTLTIEKIKKSTQHCCCE